MILPDRFEYDFTASLRFASYITGYRGRPGHCYRATAASSRHQRRWNQISSPAASRQGCRRSPRKGLPLSPQPAWSRVLVLHGRIHVYLLTMILIRQTGGGMKIILRISGPRFWNQPELWCAGAPAPVCEQEGIWNCVRRGFAPCERVYSARVALSARTSAVGDLCLCPPCREALRCELPSGFDRMNSWVYRARSDGAHADIWMVTGGFLAVSCVWRVAGARVCG